MHRYTVNNMQYVQTRIIEFIVVIAIWSLLLSSNALGQTSQPQSNSNSAQILPHLTIDLVKHTVDLDATVILREGGWLELLACSPGTRTHESIFVVHAQPSHIHLALVTLGLEPGAPIRWEYVDNQYKTHFPHGPSIVVSIVYQQQGKTIEVPANQWIVDRKTGQLLPDNTWLFVGSMFNRTIDPPTYRADSEGTVLSIVNFGDEVLARATDRTNQNDQGIWRPNTDQIPPIGTKVLLRLKPVKTPPPPILSR